jgi:hypothetical protein
MAISSAVALPALAWKRSPESTLTLQGDQRWRKAALEQLAIEMIASPLQRVVRAR